jgi:hypothetical protein
MTGVVKSAISKRLHGGRPSALQAVLAATLVGLAVAVITYRLMRG